MGRSGLAVSLLWPCVFLLGSASPSWSQQEARAVLLRTWNDPLVTEANRTFAGAEVRFAPIPFLNIAAGYYWQTSPSDGPRDGFWGYHVGVGF